MHHTRNDSKKLAGEIKNRALTLYFDAKVGAKKELVEPEQPRYDLQFSS